jgi:hypothetical protein
VAATAESPLLEILCLCDYLRPERPANGLEPGSSSGSAPADRNSGQCQLGASQPLDRQRIDAVEDTVGSVRPLDPAIRARCRADAAFETPGTEIVGAVKGNIVRSSAGAVRLGLEKQRNMRSAGVE